MKLKVLNKIIKKLLQMIKSKANKDLRKCVNKNAKDNNERFEKKLNMCHREIGIKSKGELKVLIKCFQETARVKMQSVISQRKRMAQPFFQ